MTTRSPGIERSEDAFDVFDLILGALVLVTFLVLGLVLWRLLERQA